MRRLIAVTVALLLAAGAFLAAAAQAWQPTSPALAAALFPPDGTAKVNLAAAEYMTRQLARQDPDLAPASSTVALAQAAYRREPLATDALFIIARGMRKTAPDKALPLLEKANGLSRQSNLVAVELLSTYAKAGRERGGLTVLDQVLRRETAGFGPMLEAMAKAAGNRDLHEPLLKLLATSPPWSDQFWRQLAHNPDGLDAAADLRLAFAREGGRVDPQIDRLLVAGLADSGHPGDALRVAEQVFPNAHFVASTRGNLLRNADFKAVPDFVPFDWRVMNSGDAGSSANPKEGILEVSALPGAHGNVAEQLVALPPTTVRLTGSAVATAGSSSADALHLDIVCASGALAEQTLASAPAGRSIMATTGKPCPWAWVRVRVDLPSEAAPTEWRVSALTLSAG